MCLEVKEDLCGVFVFDCVVGWVDCVSGSLLLVEECGVICLVILCGSVWLIIGEGC